MRIFILNFDNTVEVLRAYSDQAYYVNINYPKGQIFCQDDVGNRSYWKCLQRDYKGNGPKWVYAPKVPKEVLFARMLVD